jgi:hypothetical protein
MAFHGTEVVELGSTDIAQVSALFSTAVQVATQTVGLGKAFSTLKTDERLAVRVNDSMSLCI